MMKKMAFGIVDLLIALAVITVIYLLMNSSNPIVENKYRLDTQKQEANDMVEKVQKIHEKSINANQEMLNNLGE